MKVFLVVTLKEWEGEELGNENIAGCYNSMEELQAEKMKFAQRVAQ